MLGYYKVNKNEVAKWKTPVKNIEENIYDIAYPLIVGEKLPKDLLYLYEVLDIPVIPVEEIASFDFSKEHEKIDEVDKFSTYLNLNSKIEMLEEGDIGHLLRVASYAKELADSLNLEKEQIKNIYIAAIFHDVGKYLIPDQIIEKKGKLTEEEFQLMKKHSAYAFDVVKGFLSDDILKIIRSHHERCNKSGYPDGIVPGIEAKIIGIADSYDAMISNRVYHKKKTKEEAFEELILCTKTKEEGGKGVLYDKELVEKFIQINS